jgi:molybdate transport system substrate-binding protein
VLTKGHFDHLAIANPKTAPYGTAAQQVLVALGLWDRLKDRIVQGENIGQTFHFVFSKNAQLGFVAAAQISDPRFNGTGSRWDVPQHLYDPLLQQAVLLMYGRQNEAANAFLDYVKGPEARTIIEGFGYRLE